MVRVQVAVDAPVHIGMPPQLDYLADRAIPAGSLVRVPFGPREVLGLVVDAAEPAADEVVAKPIVEVLTALPPLSGHWRALVTFAAHYYQRSLGELAMQVLPPELRKASDAQLHKRIAKMLKAASPEEAAEIALPRLNDDQAAALAAFEAAIAAAQGSGAGDVAESAAETSSSSSPLRAPPRPIMPIALLFGVTGSGKTEIYLRAAADTLTAGQQALVLVPEINLTPQLEARFKERFVGRRIVSLHSGLTPAQRLSNWLAAHLGLADLVLGTRLAVFASMPRLGLIVVDEEHDPSYKQQEGARYSARDLAVYRASRERIPVLLGSATPSLETWQRAQQGRYLRLDLPHRVGGGSMPRVRLVDMKLLPKQAGVTTAVSPALRDALALRLERGEQSLVLLNRRGYAPVLFCGDCGWKSACPNCSAWRVFHKLDRTLRCHHCSFSQRVPRACPDCGNPDIAPMGRGTEKLEEQLAEMLPGACVARIDADSTRHKGTLEEQLDAVHSGEVDVLVGTQMVTKGHDFRHITLVAAVDPDAALFSSDFRAPERLFALLMQAGGRAGRDAQASERSEMLIQTWHPTHPLFVALAGHSFESFAETQLKEREMAGLPPFVSLALLRAEAKDVAVAREFLQAASELAAGLPGASEVLFYPPVPTPIARVANVERMQMLIESSSRGALQRLLALWLPELPAIRSKHRVIRWAVDVDPLAI